MVVAIGERDAGVLDGAVGVKQFAADDRDGGIGLGQSKKRSEPIGLRFSVVVEKNNVFAASGAGAPIARPALTLLSRLQLRLFVGDER